MAVLWWCIHSLLRPLNVPTHTFHPIYVATQIHFVHYIIVTNPHIVLEFIVHPGNGGEPSVDEQSVQLLCDTSTYVFYVHFGSKCHNTLIQKTVRSATVHFLTVHYKMAQQQSKFLKMLHMPRIEPVTFMFGRNRDLWPLDHWCLYKWHYCPTGITLQQLLGYSIALGQVHFGGKGGKEG